MLAILLMAAITTADLDRSEQVLSERSLAYFSSQSTLTYADQAEILDIYRQQVELWHQCVRLIANHFENTNTDSFLVVSAAFDNCAGYESYARATDRLRFDWEGLNYGSRTAHADDDMHGEREKFRREILSHSATMSHP